MVLSECLQFPDYLDTSPPNSPICSMVGKESRSGPVSAKIVAAESWPTHASQAQFYPRGLFRHSGNVLAFGDRRESTMGSNIDNRSGVLCSASLPLPKSSPCKTMPSRFHDQG